MVQVLKGRNRPGRDDRERGADAEQRDPADRAAMEPGRDDREEALTLASLSIWIDGPQWSPVAMTGKR